MASKLKWFSKVCVKSRKFVPTQLFCALSISRIMCSSSRISTHQQRDRLDRIPFPILYVQNDARCGETPSSTKQTAAATGENADRLRTLRLDHLAARRFWRCSLRGSRSLTLCSQFDGRSAALCKQSIQAVCSPVGCLGCAGREQHERGDDGSDDREG